MHVTPKIRKTLVLRQLRALRDGSDNLFKYQINTNYFSPLFPYSIASLFAYVKRYHNILCCQGNLLFWKKHPAMFFSLIRELWLANKTYASAPYRVVEP